MQTRQNFVVKFAAQTLIEHLTFGQPALLQGNQAVGQLGADHRVQQALAAGPGDFDVFLGVQSAVGLRAEQQHADRPPLTPQLNGPAQPMPLGGIERGAEAAGRTRGERIAMEEIALRAVRP